MRQYSQIPFGVASACTLRWLFCFLLKPLVGVSVDAVLQRDRLKDFREGSLLSLSNGEKIRCFQTLDAFAKGILSLRLLTASYKSREREREGNKVSGSRSTDPRGRTTSLQHAKIRFVLEIRWKPNATRDNSEDAKKGLGPQKQTFGAFNLRANFWKKNSFFSYLCFASLKYHAPPSKWHHAIQSKDRLLMIFIGRKKSSALETITVVSKWHEKSKACC